MAVCVLVVHVVVVRVVVVVAQPVCESGRSRHANVVVVVA